jgi:hypothetical protein
MTDSQLLEHPVGWDEKMHYSSMGCFCGQSCPCCRAIAGDKLGACEICLKKKEDEGKKETEKKEEGNVSRYYQKQYERFMKVSVEKEDIQDALFESVPGETYEDDTLYTRLKRNPRKTTK